MHWLKIQTQHKHNTNLFLLHLGTTQAVHYAARCTWVGASCLCAPWPGGFVLWTKPIGVSDSFSPILLTLTAAMPSQMVKTTGGPAMAASVDSPAMTAGAVSFLQEHLNNGEKALWSSLGPNWTLPRSVCVNILQIALHPPRLCHVALTRSSRTLSQFQPEPVRSSVFTRFPGWLEAAGLWLKWAAFGRSHRVRAQTRRVAGK